MDTQFKFAPGEEDRLAMGCVIVWKPYGWTVTRVLEDSPAAAAGISIGDIVASIEGRHFAQTDEIQNLLKGLFKQPSLSTIQLRRDAAILTVEVTAKPLAELIAIDWAVRGELSYCFSCHKCYTETIGWYSCGSQGCSGRCAVA